MGLKSRNKGKSGEREIASIISALTGWDVRRKVRQHGGDCDLEGIPGWSAEVKRHSKACRADLREWYEQAERQAGGCMPGSKLPVLFYRLDRGEWRAVWPMIGSNMIVHPTMRGYEWSCEGTIQGWAHFAREWEFLNRAEINCGGSDGVPLIFSRDGIV